MLFDQLGSKSICMNDALSNFNGEKWDADVRDTLYVGFEPKVF